MTDNTIKNFKILFVEDEENIRHHVSNSLRYVVKEVQESSNGREALEIMNNFVPDIIITDLNMPEMSGIEFIHEVRKKNKKICIIVLTAHTDQEFLMQLIDMHIEQYIIKPINFDKLLTVLKRCEEVVSCQKEIKNTLPSGYSYDFDKKILYFENKEIKLTRKEILFLELLIKNSFRVVTYEEIDDYVWEDLIMTDNSIRSLCKNLRKKLPINLIENLSGFGYKLV